MSNLLFVKRQSNGDLQYCVPQGYKWAITDAHRRPPCPDASSLRTQQEKTQRRWSLGPWQCVKLCPPATSFRTINPLRKHEALVHHHANAPFCSIVLNASPLPSKLKARIPPFTPPQLDKQKAVHYILNEKARMKARFSMVLPVVALSKNGEWAPQASGRKTHARLARHCSGGWAKRCVSTFDGAKIKTETVDNYERQLQFSLDKPELNSSALLLQKLHIAEEELKRAQRSIGGGRGLVHLGCADNIGSHHTVSRGSNRATLEHKGRGIQNHNAAPNGSRDELRFSVHHAGRKKKNM